jgi:hypothetical protein
MPTPIPEYLTTLDVAQQCGVDAATVRWWRRTGKLLPAAVTRRSDTALYRAADVAAFAERRRRDVVDELLGGDAA